MPDINRNIPPSILLGAQLIKKEEGFLPLPYLCTAGFATVGYGRLVISDGKRLDGPLGLEVAKKLVPNPVSEATESEWLIKRCLQIGQKLSITNLKDAQIGALISLIYNIGESAFAKSTLLKKLLDADIEGAADQFLVWCKETKNGKKVANKGLSARRGRERDMFLA